MKGRLSEMVGLGHLIKAHRAIFIVMVQQTEPQKVEEEGDARDSEDEQDFWSEEHRAKEARSCRSILHGL